MLFRFTFFALWIYPFFPHGCSFVLWIYESFLYRNGCLIFYHIKTYFQEWDSHFKFVYDILRYRNFNLNLTLLIICFYSFWLFRRYMYLCFLLGLLLVSLLNYFTFSGIHFFCARVWGPCLFSAPVLAFLKGNR